MAPRFLTNPAPKTESAREARKSFFCELCQKGYSRMNEFEAHENSYDHQHKKRLKELKQMQRDPNAADKARRAERKAEEKSGLISIKPIKAEESAASTTKGKFRKGGFKSTFGPADGVPQDPVPVGTSEAPAEGEVVPLKSVDANESDSDDYGSDYYDPKRPTGCDEACHAP